LQENHEPERCVIVTSDPSECLITCLADILVVRAIAFANNWTVIMHNVIKSDKNITKWHVNSAYSIQLKLSPIAESISVTQIKVCVWLIMKKPSQSYAVSPAIRNHASECATPQLQAEAGTQFTYHKGMKGWVDLSVGYIPSWFTCSQKVTHPTNNHLIVTQLQSNQQSPDLKPEILLLRHQDNFYREILNIQTLNESRQKAASNSKGQGPEISRNSQKICKWPSYSRTGYNYNL